MAGMENHRHTRTNIKSNQNNWKQKLREKCLKRIQEDRNHLLWKMRLPSSSSSSETTPSVNQKNIIDPTFRDIVSEELKKMKDSSSDNCTRDTLTSDDAMLDDAIWEYDGNCTTKATESECEEIMIEMQRIFYDDLRVQQSRTDIAEQAECIRTWEEEEDNYLAQAVFERLQLSNDQVDLEYLRLRLAEAHSEHLDRGCRMTPKFCMETRFNLTALYIQCQSCNTFEIVI
ncbi:uncharacterized protein LOC113330107 isoform X2 [Papaver somniferum]|uniref:uncharacterized protein LOC113330107 isoform X2 n=1 Tax=Papaver somniferum TaxID=3469 RepID=UPI000E6FE881|nr:uncharacterized protein LOC113330107 isoform X2 [Papaver somniferum]